MLIENPFIRQAQDWLTLCNHETNIITLNLVILKKSKLLKMKKLENKTVFITGGVSGIGKACAFAAAREGANVAIADLKTDSVDRVMEELIRENPKAIFIECDVADNKQVERANQQVVSTVSTLDVALNNTGITKDSDLEKFIVGLHPMKRIGKSEEIASSFIFLASNESTFITGTALEIEGGFLAH